MRCFSWQKVGRLEGGCREASGHQAAQRRRHCICLGLWNPRKRSLLRRTKFQSKKAFLITNSSSRGWQLLSMSRHKNFARGYSYDDDYDDDMSDSYGHSYGNSVNSPTTASYMIDRSAGMSFFRSRYRDVGGRGLIFSFVPFQMVLGSRTRPGKL